MPATGAIGYRVRHGWSITFVGYSAVATVIAGRAYVVYDDGTDELVPFNEHTMGVTRAGEQWKADWVAKGDGYVADFQLGFKGTSPARAQCYIVAILSDVDGSSSRETLARGYVSPAEILALGDLRPPGPASGPGNLRELGIADPAAGSEIAVSAVPAGAIWRLQAFSVQLVQGITQTPLPTMRIRDGSANILAQIPITTTAISASSTAQLTWALGVVQSSFTAIVGDEFHVAPLPNMLLQATDDFGTITDGIGANTNYGAARVLLEEWVMPA